VPNQNYHYFSVRDPSTVAQFGKIFA